jgi:hypothetical protein
VDRTQLGHSPDFAIAVEMVFEEFRNPIVPDLAPSYW